MNTNIYERVKYLRKEILNMTQDDFSKKIKISRSNLGSIETARVNITDRVICDICNAFSVNEDWLRNGGNDDDIFIELSEHEELTKYIQSLLENTDDVIADIIKNFIVIYEKLDDDSKKVLKCVAKDLLNKLNTHNNDTLSFVDGVSMMPKNPKNSFNDIPDTSIELESKYPSA
ncbi:MAG: helix-turn-helix transcriptional regulator [Lachnospiraceae bacterium]|nr:helix-turn-helix transcriptional regulator [Lachnospiraceae bacterium]